VSNQTVILSTLALLFAGQASLAQSVTPMRAVAKSYSEEFAVRLTVGNPYERTVDFEVFAYDENFEPIEALVAPSKLRISARDTRQVVVRVPFLGAGKRKVRVCAEGLFKQTNNTAVRTQVCGRFLGQRVGS
jgi:hypothetical protein